MTRYVLAFVGGVAAAVGALAVSAELHHRAQLRHMRKAHTAHTAERDQREEWDRIGGDPDRQEEALAHLRKVAGKYTSKDRAFPNYGESEHR